MRRGKLKAPYVYPGGKSAVAPLVWPRLGNPDVYAEPFAGSLAMLLLRPAGHFHPDHGARLENVTDLNFYIPNFWRAVARDPEAVAKYADEPVSEIDLHARHRYLTRGPDAEKFRGKMLDDPDHYDPKFAGWWCWGMNLWIGGAWCHDGLVNRKQRPLMNQTGYGCVGTGRRAKPVANWTQKPSLHPGNGTAAPGPRPQLADAYDVGRGTASNFRAGTCAERRAWLVEWMRALADRLRLVRVLYGDWSRVVGSDSLLTRGGTQVVGVFLDPPYPAKRGDTGEKSRDGDLYATDKHADLCKLRDDVLAWCREHGPNKLIRVAVCGYEGDGYESLESDGWSVQTWEANGGYANQHRAGKGKSANARRERIWFSPHCLGPAQPALFA